MINRRLLIGGIALRAMLGSQGGTLADPTIDETERSCFVDVPQIGSGHWRAAADFNLYAKTSSI